ncbi:hypothetical protein ELQ92_03120 [Labedella populi]|uniref:Uncharacterized protein n=1 Tax=Labedella populi TaxID=2498850 RepID=A0A3S5CP88_9MICO|nr:hypothetical protein [Labedella populi]RWZ68235.1 hypothetical protein ELQ92_03120 [Labedella populi]
MNIVIDEYSVWTTALKADRLLNRLPAEQIAHLGDGFAWDITDEDVIVARRYLVGARVQAVVLGREIARMVAAPEGVLLEHPARRDLATA